MRARCRVGHIGSDARPHLVPRAHAAAAPHGVGGGFGCDVHDRIDKHLGSETACRKRQCNGGSEVAPRAVPTHEDTRPPSAVPFASAGGRHAGKNNGRTVVKCRGEWVLWRTAVIDRHDFTASCNGQGARYEVVRVGIALRPATAMDKDEQLSRSIATRAIASHADPGDNGVGGFLNGQPRPCENARSSRSNKTRALCFDALTLCWHKEPRQPLDHAVLGKEGHPDPGLKVETNAVNVTTYWRLDVLLAVSSVRGPSCRLLHPSQRSRPGGAT